MKIAFISPIDYDSCSFYRSAGVAPDLAEKLGCDIDVYSGEVAKLMWPQLIKYKLAMFQRPFTENTLNLISYLKKFNVPIWIDFDDLIIDLPITNPAWELLTDNRENIINILSLADVVTVTTNLLRTCLLPHNKNIRVIPNAFNNWSFKTKISSAERVKTILWRGGDSHLYDLLRYTRIINKLLQNYKDWKFTFMGYLPAMFKSEYGNLFYERSTDPYIYFDKLASSGATALHVPLQDSQFNRCKSNIAWIEATYAGAVTIAPAWDEWKMPGVLNYKDDDEYYNLVSKVISGDIDTRRMVERSWSYITDKLTLSRVNELRVQVVKHLLS